MLLPIEHAQRSLVALYSKEVTILNAIYESKIESSKMGESEQRYRIQMKIEITHSRREQTRVHCTEKRVYSRRRIFHCCRIRRLSHCFMIKMQEVIYFLKHTENTLVP